MGSVFDFNFLDEFIEVEDGSESNTKESENEKRDYFKKVCILMKIVFICLDQINDVFILGLPKSIKFVNSSYNFGIYFIIDLSFWNFKKGLIDVSDDSVKNEVKESISSPSF